MAQLGLAHTIYGMSTQPPLTYTLEPNTRESFLEGPKAALVNSADFHGGHYTKPVNMGIRAFARVYCAWAYGQTVSSYITPDDSSEYSSRMTVVPRTPIPR